MKGIFRREKNNAKAWELAGERNIQDLYRFELLASILLKPNSTFLDIGANRGDYGKVAMKYANSKNVHMFEPIPYMAKYLRDTFPYTPIHEVACTDTNGNIEFFVSNYDELSGLSKRDLTTLPKGTEFTRCLVKSVVLDEYLTGVENISFVKIDVEGAEILVLNGMKKIIQIQKPVIFIEHGVNGPEYFGNTSLDLWKICKDLSYQVFTADGQLIENVDTMTDSFLNWPIWNYVLIPMTNKMNEN
jgi:FkbM family methyltransferase